MNSKLTPHFSGGGGMINFVIGPERKEKKLLEMGTNFIWIFFLQNKIKCNLFGLFGRILRMAIEKAIRQRFKPNIRISLVIWNKQS